jgi:hypothetical protein
MLDRGKEFMDELTPEVVSKFSNLSWKMLEKLWFLSGPSFENEPEIQDGHSLIEMIMAKGSRQRAINVSGKHVLELRRWAIKRLNPWRWVASTETIHLKERV